MKRILPLFVIVLALCVYPVFLRVPIEIAHVFGRIEVDMFSWYRLWIVIIVGIPALFLSQDIPMVALIYWLCLVASTYFALFFRTAIFGAPWTHEGLFALMAYIGIYILARRYGLYRALEKAFDWVIILAFLACLLQVIYGSPILFPPLKYFMPAYAYEINRMPLYSLFGSGNHLGLFCALMFPYAVLKDKWLLTGMVLVMAVGSESRGAWLSIALTTMLMGRKIIVPIALASLIAAAPMYKMVIHKTRQTINDFHYPIKNTDLDGRAYIWRESKPVLKHAILIGRGPGNYPMYVKQNEFFNEAVIDRPHNIYINTWASSGLVSLLILLAGIFVVIFRVTIDEDRALQLSCIGFLIAGLFTDSTLSITPYFIIFLGCLAHKKELLIWRYL